MSAWLAVVCELAAARIWSSVSPPSPRIVAIKLSAPLSSASARFAIAVRFNFTFLVLREFVAN